MQPFIKRLLQISLVSAVANVIPLGIDAEAAQSVTHYGITWTFSEDRPTGTFANGEPWVVGPVSVTKIDPATTITMERVPTLAQDESPYVQHGSMINPVPNGNHGFTNMNDWNLSPEKRYKESLNVALLLPINLAPGDVLVSSKTRIDRSVHNYIEIICALTVLAEAPPENSFRPGPYGKNRDIKWTIADINWSVFPNLSHVEGTPTLTSIRELLPALPWWEWSTEFSGGGIIPGKNIFTGYDQNGSISTYGREIAGKWSTVACYLMLNLDPKDRNPLIIQAIQCGIDIHSYIANGGGFPADGGHKCGRKFPLLLAAVALNDPVLSAMAADPTLFQEDQQTFIVQESDVGRPVDAPNVTYSKEHVGLGEWGIRHYFQPTKDDSRFYDGTPYRHIWPTIAGSVLAIDLMGKKEAWGHPAIFLYNERYHSISPYQGFIGNMWKRYKTNGGISGTGPSSPQNLRIMLPK